MILIIAEYLDYPTTDVISWLHSFDKKVFFISNQETVNVSIHGVNSITFFIRDTSFTLNDIEAVWFRRDRIKLNNVPMNDIDDSFLRQYHFGAMTTIESFINYLLVNKVPCLGNPERINVNKLKVLERAKRIGLNIPKTMLADNRNEVKAYFGDAPFITKLLTPLRNIKHQDKMLNFLTFACDDANMSETFSLSLFQERIEKSLEVRVLYVKGTIYSKAIFSQRDEQTKEDYRNYNRQRPNREVPFQLPPLIEEQVHKLMAECELNMGTLDFIVTKDDTFIFLEINPVGQFTELSYNCNYHAEHHIAQLLS